MTEKPPRLSDIAAILAPAILRLAAEQNTTSENSQKSSRTSANVA